MKKDIIAYIRSAQLAFLTEEHAKTFSRINIAFAVLKEHQLMIRDEDHWIHLDKIRTMNPDLEIVLSIGGAGAFGFSNMAMHQESREIFYQSMIETIDRYDLDGVDLDWEFPGSDWGGDYSLKDKENFTILIQGMREKLDEHSQKTGKRYLLTIAAAVGQWFIDQTEVSKFSPYLDQVMLMTYDLRGFGQEYTALFNLPNDPYAMSADEGLQLLIENGCPKEKIVIGAAMYARHWEKVPKNNQGLLEKVKAGGGDYFLEYPALEKEAVENPDYQRFWDDQAKVPWLYSEKHQHFITYDDEESVKEKCHYILKHDLPGIMFWQYVHWDENPLIEVMKKQLK